MNVPVGVNTASLQKRRTVSVKELVYFIIKNNFSAVEFRDEYPFGENLTTEDAEWVREALAEHKIPVSVHLPFYDINLSAFREDVRLAGVNILLKSLEKAAELGAVTATIHGGSMRSNFYAEDWFEKAYELSIDSLKRIVSVAESLGITILLENLNLFKKSERVVHAFPDIMLKTKEALENKIGFTFDVGHAVSTPIDPVSFVLQLGPDNVRLAHLNDNHLKSDEHLAVGDGLIDYPSFIKAYITNQWKFPLLFETHSVESALKSKKYLEGLIAEVIELIDKIDMR